MKEYGKWNRQDLSVQTRVCRCCGKRKDISQFYFQKPPRVPVFCINRRNDCSSCHNKQTRSHILKTTTAKERAEYIRKYYKKNKIDFQVYKRFEYLAQK